MAVENAQFQGRVYYGEWDSPLADRLVNIIDYAVRDDGVLIVTSSGGTILYNQWLKFEFCEQGEE